MDTTIVIIASIAMVALIVWAARKSKNKLLGEGRIVEREAKFFEKKETFITTARFSDVASIIMAENFSDVQIEIIPDVPNQRLHFVSHDGYEWKAVLKYIGNQGDKNFFEFSFLSWKTRNGVTGSTGMNCLLTSVEKAFLKVDWDTLYEFEDVSYKTKTQL